jgi:hypothetical protein
MKTACELTGGKRFLPAIYPDSVKRKLPGIIILRKFDSLWALKNTVRTR